MRKKSTKKNEEKTHKHSRRRRKSSSSAESETESSDVQPSEVPDEPVEEPKTRRGRKSTDTSLSEAENNTTPVAAASAGAVGRITRHSRRLAAITTPEEVKEGISEVLSPSKAGKSSPHSGNSPVKDSRKKDGTPDKHKAKDTWTVESANGSGVQKLKIRLQRFPEASTSGEEAEGDGETQNVENDGDQSVSCETNDLNVDDDAAKAADFISEVSQNDVADIQLPPSEVEETVPNSQPPVETQPDSEDQHAEEVENIKLPPEPEPQPVINDVEISEIAIPEPEQIQEVVSKIHLPDEKAPEEIPLPIEGEDADKIEADKVVESERTNDEVVEKSETADKSGPEVENVEPKTASSEVAPSPQQALSEQEDIDSQAELVLTFEDNAMEEQTSSVAPVEETDSAPTKNEESKTSKKESVLPSLSQVEMEEVYDYEQDDTKEEGELSANEAMSPIHEVFKKLPAEERKRSWGACSIFNFNRNSIVANEQILREHQIVKRVINKDDLESSESEDLIFVKEIREENIVHDIESEPGNNTSFTEKDLDAEKEEKSSDVRRRRTLESDKVIEKPSKRHPRESSRTVISGEGKTVLYITNLVRPFTVTQLRELLQRTGRIVENGFWIDSIKSKCYVQFENSDQAIETRHALHGIRWPVNNPKVLSVHFATPEELAAAQEPANESETQRKEPLTVSNHNNDTAHRHIDWKKHFEQYDERPRKVVRDVREWDIGKPADPDEMIWEDEATEYNKKKEAEQLTRSRRDNRDRDRERDNRKRRSDLSDDEPRSKRHRKTANDTQPPPAEAKLLDDLFRRTKTSPSIYWLPLSEEQIAVKQEARRKHLEDIGKQLKDRSGDREPPRRRERDHRRSRR